jgi:hypothetical protein
MSILHKYYKEKMYYIYQMCFKFTTKKCKYCNKKLKVKTYDFCDALCEYNDLYKDSFRTLDLSQRKYIYDLNI